MRPHIGLWSLAVAAAACGGGSSPTGTDGGGGLGPYAFLPNPVTVKVGTTVKWTNLGTTGHTTTSDEATPIWNSGTVSPAGTTTCTPGDPYCQPGTTPPGSYQRTFMTAGTYQYHCQFHQAQGMTGTIT